MSMPPLETERLIVRPFTMDDLQDIYRILDVELGDAEVGSAGAKLLDERQQWLEWSVLSYAELAKLYQPPYGDRAIELKQTRQVIGACGYAPAFGPFDQLPYSRYRTPSQGMALNTPEFGLYWAISPAFQRQGFAAEAGKALIDYAFSQLQLKRIVATTSYDNEASMGVMRKLGMRIEKNPYPEPPWFQVVGILEHSPANLLHSPPA
jgi:RimJ/RimL family protein N-acetyltransferase